MMLTFGYKNKGNLTVALEEGNEVITDGEKLAQILLQAWVSIFFTRIRMMWIIIILTTPSQSLRAIKYSSYQRTNEK